MHFSTDKKILQKIIGQIVGVISSRATLPILANILLETEGKDKLRAVGTDLELGVSSTGEVRVEEEGAITAPAKKLHDILRELPDGEVEFVVAKNHNITIKAGRSQFRLVGIPKDDFPKLPSLDVSGGFEIEQAVLKECFRLTSFSISHDQTRYVLSGTLVSVKNNELRVIATDGRRLAYVRKKVQIPKNTEFEAILPMKTTSELNRLLEDVGTVKIVPLKNQVGFETSGATLISRLIEGRFPNYEQVIPKEEKSKISLDREALLTAMRRAALLTSQEAQAIKLDVLEDKILLSSRSPNVGESQEELPAKLSGKEIAIGFNPQYLIDVLKNLDGDEVFLSLSDPDKSGIVRGASDEYLYVVMPMQLA